MARRKTSNYLSASILAGSEEVFDFYCAPCSSTRHVEAVGYCQECSEYLCTACIDYHGKLSMSKEHTVLDKLKMPKVKPPAKIQHTDVLIEKCRKHPDKVLEYFCKVHGQVCCSVCLTLTHNSCSYKGYIPDISDGIDKSQEYKLLIADLERLIRDLTKQQEMINNSSKHNKKYHSTALVDITEFRTQINELLDRIEQNTKQKIANFQQANIDVIRCATEKCQTLLSDVTTMAVDVEKVEKTGKRNQLFVKVKLARRRKEELEIQMNENGEYQMMRYAFHKEEKIQQMMSTLPAIWSLSTGQDVTPTEARYVRKVKVKTDDDTEECTINGIVSLTNDCVVVIDRNNKNVKLINMNVNQVVSRLSLSSMPFDITEIKPNQVAVAYGREHDKKIGIITVSGELTKKRTINTPNTHIVALCYNGSHFITTCHAPSRVDIIDKSGKTLKTYSMDSSGKQFLTSPHHIALSCNKDVIYITDKTANSLTSLSPGGQVISVFRHDKLMHPVGVAVGPDGVVYVSSRDTNAVHQLTPTADLTRIILRPDQGVNYRPAAIAYNKKKDMLYISSYSKKLKKKNYIRLYQLE